jgi:hypothetical protein
MNFPTFFQVFWNPKDELEQLKSTLSSLQACLPENATIFLMGIVPNGVKVSQDLRDQVDATVRETIPGRSFVSLEFYSQMENGNVDFFKEFKDACNGMSHLRDRIPESYVRVWNVLAAKSGLFINMF